MPLVLDLLSDVDDPVLDQGCGEGQTLRALPGRRIFGCDASRPLLRRARSTHPVVRSHLPQLGWLSDGGLGASYAVLVLEHLPDLDGFFAEAARVTRSAGHLVVIMNHPAFTPPDAGPIVDLSDGEVLWRWGPYFDEIAATEPAGERHITFHHRPLGRVLEAASAAGWCLDRLVELPLSAAAIAEIPGYAGQEHLPRLLGMRWRRT